MKYKIIQTLMIGIFLINLSSALTINSGECEVINLNTTETLYYIISGNSSSMDGMNITYEIFGDYTNITVCLHPMYKPDNFTIIFIDNSTKEVIKDVHHYSSGGTKKVYVDREIIKYITLENDFNCSNQTDIIYLSPEEYPEEKNWLERFWEWIKKIFSLQKYL